VSKLRLTEPRVAVSISQARVFGCDVMTAAGPLQQAAEEILSELRDCPPAEGFHKVEVCGEREHARRARGPEINLPVRTWDAIRAAAAG
jgi:LDH2 family malate/lactate/ureidoglycolate dehydrogenase